MGQVLLFFIARRSLHWVEKLAVGLRLSLQLELASLCTDFGTLELRLPLKRIRFESLTSWLR